jgi:subtilisin family serine protease
VPLRFPRPVIPVIAAGMAAVWVAASSAPALADQVRQEEFWLSQLGVSQAWQATQGSGVTVAVLSDGVDTQQPDLAGSVTTGPDYTGTGQEFGSFFGAQGTAAASLIAGRGTGAGGNSGIIGIAPRARILAVRVTLDPGDPALDSSAAGAALPGAIASGIRYAVAHGASVIDLPLDPGRPNPTAIAALPIPRFSTQAPQLNGIIAAEGGSVAEQQAVAYAISQGVVLVAPAGDNALGTDAANFPAAYPHVISVGAFDSSFNRGAFSSNQPYVTVTAPGVGVTAADAARGYTSVSSTAAASAIVSGIAALIKAQFPHLTPAQVSQALSTSTVVRPPGGQAAGSGTGSVDAGRAMLAAATLAAPASARAGAQAQPLTSPAAPVVARVASSLTPRLVRAAVISLGVLILLLAAIWWYSRAGRRHQRDRAQATAQWAPSSQNAFSPYGPGDDRTEADRMLEYFAAPSSHPVAVSSPFGASRGVLTTSRDGAGREAPSAPGAQGAWSSDAPPPRAPSRHARVSGTPPWEPASQPASELPWAAIPGPAGGGRAAARHAGGPAADSVWPSSPAAAPASASRQSWEELAASVTAAAQAAEPAPPPAADTARASDREAGGTPGGLAPGGLAPAGGTGLPVRQPRSPSGSNWEAAAQDGPDEAAWPQSQDEDAYRAAPEDADAWAPAARWQPGAATQWAAGGGAEPGQPEEDEIGSWLPAAPAPESNRSWPAGDSATPWPAHGETASWRTAGASGPAAGTAAQRPAAGRASASAAAPREPASPGNGWAPAAEPGREPPAPESGDGQPFTGRPARPSGHLPPADENGS